MIYYHIFLNKIKIACLGSDKLVITNKYRINTTKKYGFGVVAIKNFIINCFSDKIVFRTCLDEKENNSYILYIENYIIDRDVQIKNPGKEKDRCILTSILGYEARRESLYSIGYVRKRIILDKLNFDFEYYPFKVDQSLVLPIVNVNVHDFRIEIDGEITNKNPDSFDDSWGWHSNSDDKHYTKRTRDDEGYLIPIK